MGAKLRFTDEKPVVFIVPRLEDELIDELFYQEDEIGEMRHTAFMIECGLEEDPPDGPDVPPIPWLDNYSDNSSEDSTPPKTASAPPRLPGRPVEKVPPKHSSSLDDIVLQSSPKKKEPARKLVAAKSGSLATMQKAIAEKSPERKDPARRLVGSKSGTLYAMRTAITNDEPPKEPVRIKKLVAAKSGSLHAMRDAAKKAAEAASETADEERQRPRSDSEERIRPASKLAPSARRKLYACKSGTLHGMRKNAEEDAKTEESKVADAPPKPARPTVRKVAEAEEVKSVNEPQRPPLGRREPKSGSETKTADEPPKSEKREPKRGSLTHTNSGSVHIERMTKRADRKAAAAEKVKGKADSTKGGGYVIKNGVKTQLPRKNSANSSESESWSGMDNDSDSEAVSISTVESSDDNKAVAHLMSKLSPKPVRTSIESLPGSSPSGRTDSKIELPLKSPKKEKKEKKTKKVDEKPISLKKGDELPKVVRRDDVKDRCAAVESNVRSNRDEDSASRRPAADKQKKSGVPLKANSVAAIQIPPAFMNRQASTSVSAGAPRSPGRLSGRTKKSAIPSKSLSVANIDVPPAFRSMSKS